MDEPIVVRHRITFEGMKAAQRAHARGGKFWMFRVIASVVLILLVLLSLAIKLTTPATGDETFYSESATLLLGLGMVALAWPVIQQKRSRAIYKSMPARDSEVLLLITPDGIHQDSEIGVSDVKWEAFITVQEHRDLFLLFSQSDIYHWLPKSAFENEEAIAAFAELARAKVGSYRVVM